MCRQDGGVPSQAATSAAPPVAARPESAPYRWAFSLHGDSVLPTRRIASPYTEGLGFLHGETELSARHVTYRDK